MAETVVVNILANLNDRASSGLGKVKGEITGLEPASQRASRGIGGLGATATKTFAIIGGGAALFGGAAAGAVKATQAYIANARQLQRMSRATGVQTRELSRLNHAFVRSGLDGTDLQAVLNELNIRVIDAKDGTEDTARAFNQLGLQWQDLENLSPDETLFQVVEALQRIDNVALRGNIADRIFGGDDAQRILAIGGNLGRLVDEADRFGTTIDERAAQAAERFQQALDRLGAAAEGQANQFAAAVVDRMLPAIQAFSTAIGVLPDDTEAAMISVQDRLAASEEDLVAVAKIVGQRTGESFGEGLSRVATEAWNRWTANFAQSANAIQQRIAALDAYQQGGRALADFRVGGTDNQFQLTLDGLQRRSNLDAEARRRSIGVGQAALQERRRGRARDERIADPFAGFYIPGGDDGGTFETRSADALRIQRSLRETRAYLESLEDEPPPVGGLTPEQIERNRLNRERTLAGRLGSDEETAARLEMLAAEAFAAGFAQLGEDLTFEAGRAREAGATASERALTEAEREERRALLDYFRREQTLASRLVDIGEKSNRFEELAIEATEKGLDQLAEDFEFYAERAEAMAEDGSGVSVSRSRGGGVSRSGGGRPSIGTGGVNVYIFADVLVGDDEASLTERLAELVQRGLIASAEYLAS